MRVCELSHKGRTIHRRVRCASVRVLRLLPSPVFFFFLSFFTLFLTLFSSFDSWLLFFCYIILTFLYFCIISLTLLFSFLYFSYLPLLLSITSFLPFIFFLPQFFPFFFLPFIFVLFLSFFPPVLPSLVYVSSYLFTCFLSFQSCIPNFFFPIIP